MSKAYIQTLKEVTNLPTAPFVEDCVADHIRRFVAARPALRLKADKYGNLLVRYTPRAKSKTRPKGRPILFTAHMDHPGFIAGKMLGEKRLEAEWAGGVQARYFKNQNVMFRVEDRWIPGVIEKVIYPKPPKRAKQTAGPKTMRFAAAPAGAIVTVQSPVPRGALGMWRLPDTVIRGHRLHARVTDDLSGLAAILCALDDLCRKRAKMPCYALFSRAEEVGFAGALTAIEAGTIPKSAIIIVVENSKELPGVAELGNGPVLRIGDKMTVFSPAVTSYCRTVADNLAKKDRTFRYQRKLMDGGSCEATAYCHHGLDANCICLPLVNYHNMDVRRKTIAPEAVDTRDYINLVKWFIALAESPMKTPFGGGDPTLDKKLADLLRKHRRRLASPAQA